MTSQSGADSCAFSLPHLAYRQVFKMLGQCEYGENSVGNKVIIAAPCILEFSGNQATLLWIDEEFYADPRPEGVGIQMGYYNAVVNRNVDSDQPTHSEFTWQPRYDPDDLIYVDVALYGQLQTGDEITICSAELVCKPCLGAYQEWDVSSETCDCIEGTISTGDSESVLCRCDVGNGRYNSDSGACSLCPTGKF